MKKTIAVAAVLILCFSLFAGGAKESTKSDESVEIVVFAAASMTETLNKLGSDYMAANPFVKIVYNFDSSGTLKTQIEEGAYCDVFISAGQKQMNQIDINASKDINKNGLDFVLEGTRFDILENKVALAVPKGNPEKVSSYDDLAKRLQEGKVLLAMGNSDVPVGQYTQKILAYYKLDEKALAASGVVTYCSNVKEVTTQVAEAVVSCGIIYQTDAFSAGLEVVDTASAEMCGQVIYPAAIIKNTKNEAATRSYVEYLKSEKAGEVFAKVGFTPLSK